MDASWKILTWVVLILSFTSGSSGRLGVRLRADAQCPMAGYFRDETDCHKFYRCAEHSTGIMGKNYYTKAEFHCPSGTIFDETLSNCNHVMFVENLPPECNTDNGGIVHHVASASTPSPTILPVHTASVVPIDASSSSIAAIGTPSPSSLLPVDTASIAAIGTPSPSPVSPPTSGSVNYPPPSSIVQVNVQQHVPLVPAQAVPENIQMVPVPSLQVPVLPSIQIPSSSNSMIPSFPLPENNLQNIGSYPIDQSTNISSSKPEGWLTPTGFPQNGWVVPDNFPTFYSLLPPQPIVVQSHRLVRQVGNAGSFYFL